MKYPINEDEIVKAFNVHIEGKMTQSDESFLGELTAIINKAYEAGVRDGLRKIEES